MDREEFVVQQQVGKQRKLLENLIDSMARTETFREQLETYQREQAPVPPDTFGVESLASYTVAQKRFREEEGRLSNQLRNEQMTLDTLKADVMDLLPLDIPLIYEYGAHGGIANFLGAYEIRSTMRSTDSRDEMFLEIRKVGNPGA